VPSELVSQKEVDAFLLSVRGSEDHAVAAFNKTFRSMEKEDFKRWHFVHRIENVFDSLDLQVAKGLCRGFAQDSSIWTSDAFELFAAIRCTRMTLFKMKEQSDRQSFLQILIGESNSALYGLLLVDTFEKEDGPERPLSDLTQIKNSLKEKMRKRYLGVDAPSVFEEFSNDLGKIEPIRLLLGWRRLGPDAELEQQKYLSDLLSRRPSDLNWFLRMMFRVDFMDDYAALKPLIDYTELAKLIEKHIALLDATRVEKFREKYRAERGDA
jgi:hypothetical protein